MFFNRHLKQGKDAGVEALNIVHRCFQDSQFLTNDQLHLPEDFFDDYYIRGYFTSWLGYIKDFAYEGKNWSTQKKGEFLLAGLDALDPSGKLHRHHLSLADFEIRDIVLNSEEFAVGSNHAITCVGLAYDRLRPDDPDPIIAEARALAKSFIDNGLDPKGSVGAAAQLLTIFAYVREKWVDDDA